MASKPGKTAPRLLQDLSTYDPRYEERAGRNLLTSAPPEHNPDSKPVPAVPARNCRHRFLNKSEQCVLPRAGEEPDHTTVYKIASFCQSCHWHFDLIVDFRDDGSKNDPCRKSHPNYPLHHFLFRDEEEPEEQSVVGSQAKSRTFIFSCSASKCPVALRIRLTPPRFSDADVNTLTNRSLLRRRWEAAKQIAGDRADTSMARPVDAPDFLNTYLQDSLNPQKGKSRIPLMNRKFLKTFGKDCDSILKRLGFTSSVETEDDGSAVDVWYLPKPPPAGHPLEKIEPTERNVIEDARYELNAIILNFSEPERSGARHIPMYPPPSRNDMERALGCHDYEKAKGRMETRSTNHEEDHPYYAGLGAVGDFDDRLLLFAYQRQTAVDGERAPYYFECLQDLSVGRKSEYLQQEVAMLASQGSYNRREVTAAYRYFGIQIEHVAFIADDHIIGVFRSRLSDISPSMIEETRRQLRIIGNARNSDRIRQEASDAIETYEQALSWLDLDKDQPDDFVPTMFGIKTSDNPSSLETARKAVQIIAEHRNSRRLIDFLEKGSMAAADMDVAEAYALLAVEHRSAKLDLNVLEAQLRVMAESNPESAAKYQEAFEKVRRDQEDTHGKSNDYYGAPRKTYPLESWPVGLDNIGNTCYLNSVLQFLFTVKPLREMVLNCEDHLEELTPEALGSKRVGRTAISSEKVATAQRFVRELRKLFESMITASTTNIRPERELAILALTRSGTDNSTPVENNTPHSGLGNIGGLPISGPILPPNGTKESKPASPADSVMGDNESTKDMDLTTSDEPNGATATQPEPPSRPPPVPPRPQASADTTFKRVESIAQQQDAAEILNNAFDLISCAIKGESTLRDGEQLDLIKRLFFSDVTNVRNTQGKFTPKSDLQDNILVSTKNRDRSLCAALDDEFGQTELEDGTQKFEYIGKASPFQIINVRRLQFEGGNVRKDESHLVLDKVLYLDRYLQETKSLSENELLQLRETQWAKQKELRLLDASRENLKKTEFEKVEMPDVLEETACFIDDLKKAQDEQLIDVAEDSVAIDDELAGKVKARADQLVKEIAEMDAEMAKLEQEIDSVFEGCMDHPYRLHAIFMHRGSAAGGHYWIYIYDFQNDLWRKYNDDYVDLMSEEEVFKREEKNPATSTGIIYVREDVVHEYTEAVHRNPQETSPPHTDVEMKDVTAETQPAVVNMDDMYKNLEVINGVEKE